MIFKVRNCLILLVLIFKIGGCKRTSLPHSIGARDEVILIAPGEFQVDSFVNTLEKQEYYPTEESIFNVKRVNLSEFDRYKFWRNLIIIGNFEQKYINNLLGEEAKKEVEKEAQLFLENDLWVRLQTVVVISGMNTEETQKLLDRSSETIYKILRNEEKERFTKVVYMNGFQENKTEEMERLLGASYQLPFGYKLVKNEYDFLTYSRKNPDRILTLLVRRDPIKDPIKFRDSLFAKYFRGDEIFTESIELSGGKGKSRSLSLISLDTIQFRGTEALKLKGVWFNDKVESGPMGGPFISYFFEKDGISYFLDGHVFAPGKKKWPFLEEVDIILNTFKREK
jgi:hypothetical protein